MASRCCKLPSRAANARKVSRQGEVRFGVTLTRGGQSREVFWKPVAMVVYFAPMRIWTIGHSTREIDAFISLLEENVIKLLADVRSWPRS